MLSYPKEYDRFYPIYAELEHSITKYHRCIIISYVAMFVLKHVLYISDNSSSHSLIDSLRKIAIVLEGALSVVSQFVVASEAGVVELPRARLVGRRQGRRVVGP